MWKIICQAPRYFFKIFLSLLIKARAIMLPISTKNTAPIEARLTAWNPKILLNLIIPIKIKIEFIKFKVTAAVLKNLPIAKKMV